MDVLFPLIAIVIPSLAALFLVMRFAVLWYFKIDKIAGHLASIDHSLKQLPAVRREAYGGREGLR